MMDITSLDIECSGKGTRVKVWCKCQTPEEIDDLIAWLRFARVNMIRWEGIIAVASARTTSPQRQGDRTESQCQLEPPSPIVTDGE